MTLQEMSGKDVIQYKTGEKLGNIDDFEFDEKTATITAAILRGRKHFFGLLGRDEDLVIPWETIKTVGTDVIMTEADAPTVARVPRHRWYW